MTYYKQEWRNGDPTTPISAARLEHIEDGIFTAHELGEREGKPGPQGPAGVAGPAGEPGHSPVVGVSDSSYRLTVDGKEVGPSLRGPAGEPGEPGESGGTDQPAMFSHDETYSPGDKVTYNGAEWVAGSGVKNHVTRTNILDNPRFANNRSGWSASASSTLTVGEGTLTAVAKSDVSANNSVGLSKQFPTQLPATYSAAVTVHNPLEKQVAVNIKISGYSPSLSSAITSATLEPGETRRLTVDGFAVTESTGIRLVFLSGGMVQGDTVVFSQPVLEVGDVAGEYFDGDTAGAQWDGEPDNSTSTIKVGPSEATGWEKIIRTPEVKNGATPLGTLSLGEPEKMTIYPGDLDSTRTRFLSEESPTLRMSTDDCKTWSTVHVFDDPVRTVRWLDDGEALVSTKKADNSEAFRLWRSSGLSSGDPATATWAEVMQGKTVGNGPSGGWSWFIEGNICLVADYGKKDGSENQARFVYLSTDMGRTWEPIFELERKPGLHTHGVAFDKWWNRIWVSHGDDEDGIYVSDDLGATWRRVKHGDIPSAPGQVVGIVPLEDCILFASDGVPNGIMRISRSQGRNAESYELETAVKFNDIDRISHLCHGIYQAKDIPGAPVLFGFGAETIEGKSVWAATRTGYDATVIYEDSVVNPAGVGARSCFGPTLRGNIILTSNEKRFNSGRIMWRAPWPDAYLYSAV